MRCLGAGHASMRACSVAVPRGWVVPCVALVSPRLPLPVAKSAKFLVLFKRPGNVVLVNPRGDLIVNPSACRLPCADR